MKYLQLVKAIDSASQQLLGRAAAAVNQALVLRNWLIGAYIVEFEQNGEDRAKYGEGLLEILARDLVQRGLAGLSTTNLKQCRQLYWAYPQIRQTVSDQFTPLLAVPAIRQTPSADSVPLEISSSLMRKSAPHEITPFSADAILRYSWSHLLEFIRLDDPLKRAFYENECLKGNWSVRQLQRQIGSLLFERTGLSKNKAAVVARARKQEPQQNIEDLIRDAAPIGAGEFINWRHYKYAAPTALAAQSGWAEFALLGLHPIVRRWGCLRLNA
jgi:hypothetical protein